MDYFLTLEFAGFYSIILCIIGLLYAVPQAKLYYKMFLDMHDDDAKAHILKLLVIVCSLIIIFISVFLYSTNILSFEGAQPYRLVLKWVQNIAITCGVFGLRGLSKYYKELGQ